MLASDDRFKNLALEAGAAGPERSNQLMYANVTYDLNAAIRVATEFERVETLYAKNIGQNNTFRLAAFYFF